MFLRSPGPAPRRDLTYQLVVRALRGLFRLLGLRITIEGLHHVPATGPAILAANHTGYLDFTFVGLLGTARGRLVRFLAKQSTFDNPVSGPAMRAMGHIPVLRPDGTVAALRASRALGRGEMIGIFPEATISRSFTLKQLRRGPAYLAAAHRAPLVPVVTWGGHRLLTVGGRFGLRRGTAVTLLVGEPIQPGPADTVTELEQRLQVALTELYDRAQREYPQRPRGRRDRWWVPAHLGGTAPTPARAAELEIRLAPRSATT